MRENALSSLVNKPSYTALYTWTSLPSLLTPVLTATLCPNYTQTGAWEFYWHAFVMEAMHSDKGAYKTSASGWEVGNEGNTEEHGARKGFCGLLRWADVERHKAYIDRLQAGPRQEGELCGLNDLLTFQTELCHVKFTCLKYGWLGSVAKERPDVKYPSGLFKQETTRKHKKKKEEKYGSYMLW